MLTQVAMPAHTPGICSADQTDTFQHEALEQFVENARRFVHGKELFNIVDKASGY